MPMPFELERGFHISTPTSRVTPLEEGVFIPYDGCWGKRMRALKEFVSTYYDEAEKTFPYLFEDHVPREEMIERSLRLHEQLSRTEGYSQE